MDLLRCVLCEMNEGFDEPPYPHEHHRDAIPVTPCRPCMFGEHDYCHPIAPYWCACDCGLTD